ncbi:hypothetical protein WN51_00640 [Melipona quadrifasciata]|uniref:Uncharacterized protein n=1 Tax=Melipona quadrifasciata TaxID=166423 RepID=A0A0M9A181_9HYME|nr:hypothetical protein WN51_00640 [Melipona quadrifasciata]
MINERCAVSSEINVSGPRIYRRGERKKVHYVGFCEPADKYGLISASSDSRKWRSFEKSWGISSTR